MTRWRTCCWPAPYRCCLVKNSTSAAKLRRALLTWPFPPNRTKVSSGPHALLPAVQLFSIWSPTLLRRKATSWATEHGDGVRDNVESPGSNKGWSIGSQHIFLRWVTNTLSLCLLLFKLWKLYDPLFYPHPTLYWVYVPNPAFPPSLYCIIHYGVTWCGVYIIFSQKRSAMVNYWISPARFHLVSLLLQRSGTLCSSVDNLIGKS